MNNYRLMKSCPYDTPVVRVIVLRLENPCLVGSNYGAYGAAGDYTTTIDIIYPDAF